jgi:hypothetical protein
LAEQAIDSGSADPDLEDYAVAASGGSCDPIALERALVAEAEQAIDSGSADPDPEDYAVNASDGSGDPIALERALVAEAEQALEDKEYQRAARCFARAVEFAPSRVDYLVMSGHCLKDAGDFGGAFAAYSAALAALPTGDTHVQLGISSRSPAISTRPRRRIAKAPGSGRRPRSSNLQTSVRHPRRS